MSTIIRYATWIALAAAASAEAVAIFHRGALPWWIVAVFELWWWTAIAVGLSSAARIRRPVARAACLGAIATAFAVYAISWGCFVRSWGFLSVDTLRFALHNARDLFRYTAQMEPTGIRVLGAAIGAALIAGALWLRASSPAPPTPGARRRRRLLWLSCTAVLQIWLLAAALDTSELRRAKRFHALGYELNPAVALVASVAAALSHEPIEPVLDRARLTPLSVPWQPSEHAARTSIVLVAVEALRSDAIGLVHQGREVMPRLSALGREGIAFTRAYAQSTHSNYSDPTVVSSLHPLRTRSLHLYRRSDPWPKTLLYDLLAARGYRAAMFSSQNEAWGSMDAFYESPSLERFVDAERSGLPTRVSGQDIGVAAEVRAGTLRAGILDDRVTTDLALAWLASVRREQPFVLVLTYQDSHFPYELEAAEPRPFQPATVDFDAQFGSWDAVHVPVLRNAYFNALHASDRQIGRVLDALREQGRWDDTIVVVYGENGECFHENGCINHAGVPWEPAIHVGCVLRAPGHGARVDDYPLALIDVAPTLLGLLGHPPHPGFQGIDALAAGRPDPDRRRLFFHAKTVDTDGMIASGRYKYVVDHARRREAVYDLAADPGEQRNLVRAQPELAAELRAMLGTWRSGQLAYYHFATYYGAYYPPAFWGEGPALAR